MSKPLKVIDMEKGEEVKTPLLRIPYRGFTISMTFYGRFPQTLIYKEDGKTVDSNIFEAGGDAASIRSAMKYIDLYRDEQYFAVDY